MPAVPPPAIRTVLGPLAPERLGPTLMHEHLLCDLRPLGRRGAELEDAEITLADAFDANYRAGDYQGNHRLRDRAAAIEEVARFRAAGGGAIVEVTTGGIGPDPDGLAAIARATGVPIVLGAGFYTEAFLDAGTRALSTERLTEIVAAQVSEGAWGTAVRCGIIGEVGCSWPLTPFEARGLRAAARAQRRTGAAITIHPGRDRAAPGEILDLLEGEGADASRVILGHMDRTLLDPEDVVALARRGCVVEYDFFGVEHSNYWLGPLDLPNDWMRLRALRRLFDAGLGDRVVISHDICTRSRLQRNGGHGYGHIPRNVVPLMRERGFSQDEIDGVLVDTPRRLLTMPA